MNINESFTEILNYAHFWNWAPDWDIVQKIYQEYPESYSVLTPFAYAYLEELIRSTTSEYGIEIHDNSGNTKRRKVGMKLIELALNENKSNAELTACLEKIKPYYEISCSTDSGDNRNSVAHGYMHSKFWNKDAFEKLINDIASLSKHAGF